MNVTYSPSVIGLDTIADKCDWCGALVGDQPQHTKFHNVLRDGFQNLVKCVEELQMIAQADPMVQFAMSLDKEEP